MDRWRPKPTSDDDLRSRQAGDATTQQRKQQQQRHQQAPQQQQPQRSPWQLQQQRRQSDADRGQPGAHPEVQEDLAQRNVDTEGAVDGRRPLVDVDRG